VAERNVGGRERRTRFGVAWHITPQKTSIHRGGCGIKVKLHKSTYGRGAHSDLWTCKVHASIHAQTGLYTGTRENENDRGQRGRKKRMGGWIQKKTNVKIGKNWCASHKKGILNAPTCYSRGNTRRGCDPRGFQRPNRMHLTRNRKRRDQLISVKTTNSSSNRGQGSGH